MSRYYRAGILLFMTLNFIGCTSELDNEKNIKAFRLPVVAECESFVKTFFTGDGVGTAIKSKYFSFDRTLKSHPDVVGYLEIYTDGVTNIGIESSVNGILWECYPESAVYLDINGDLPSKLKGTIELNKKLGIKNNYIVLDNEKLKVYFSRKHRGPK